MTPNLIIFYFPCRTPPLTRRPSITQNYAAAETLVWPAASFTRPPEYSQERYVFLSFKANTFQRFLFSDNQIKDSSQKNIFWQSRSSYTPPDSGKKVFDAKPSSSTNPVLAPASHSSSGKFQKFWNAYSRPATNQFTNNSNDVCYLLFV